MPASPMGASTDDASAITDRARQSNKGAPVCAMTRHKHELAMLVGLRARSSAKHFMHVLLKVIGHDGVAWVSLDWIREQMPRSERRAYHRRTLELQAVWWKKQGVLSWDWVKAFGRFPRRARDGTLLVGQGRRTFSGGRIWRVDLAAFRALCLRLSSVGTKSGVYDLQIVSAYDLQIGASDHSRSPSEILKMDPAPPAERRRAAAPPTKASETPGRASPSHIARPAPPAPAPDPNKASETPGRASPSNATRAAPAPDPNKASETPGGDSGSLASHRDPPRHAADKSAIRGRAGREDGRGEPPAPFVTAAQMAADLTRILGLRSPGAASQRADYGTKGG